MSMNPRQVLLALALKYNGNWDRMYEVIKNKEPVTEEDIENYNGSNYITLIDPEYPQALKAISHPPFVLFYKGNVSLLRNQNKIFVLGHKTSSLYSGRVCENIVYDLLEHDTTIITDGLSDIGQITVNTIVNSKRPGIVVISQGLDTIDMSNILEHHGLVLSEYPDSTTKDNIAPSTVDHTRIASSLSKGVVVPEIVRTPLTDKAMQQILSIGTELWVVPHPIDDYTYNNDLIKMGATCITSAKDILQDLKKED